MRTVNQIDTEGRGKSHVKMSELVGFGHQAAAFGPLDNSVLRGMFI
jgi:hypothetical protein